MGALPPKHALRQSTGLTESGVFCPTGISRPIAGEHASTGWAMRSSCRKDTIVHSGMIRGKT